MAGGLGVSSLPFGGFGGVHTLLGALPVLLHPSPKNVAVIGLGSGDTAFAAAGRSETELVEVVEIVGSQLDLLRDFDALGQDPGCARCWATRGSGSRSTTGAPSCAETRVATT